MKSNHRKQLKESNRKKRKSMAEYLKGGGKSLYARKHAFLSKHGYWGFEFPIGQKSWK